MSSVAIHREPITESAPVLVDVVYDSNYLDAGWSVALLKSDGQTHVAFRTTRPGLRPFEALRQSHNPDNWIVLPEELGVAVLDTAQKLRATQEAEILRGYEEMAADEEREREALEWSEGLIGDAFEAG